MKNPILKLTAKRVTKKAIDTYPKIEPMFGRQTVAGHGQKANLNALMKEVDINVKKLIELFRFILKYKIIFRGRGIEFAGLREYTPEDDASRIDWRSTARTGKVYVKIFEEERDLDLFLLIDVSNSMLFGTAEKLKSEYATILAATIAFAGIEAGDKVGIGLFSDKMTKVIPPAQGSLQYFKILKAMVDPENYGGACNLSGALHYVNKFVRKRSIIFVVSDFIGSGQDWGDELRVTGYRFDRLLGIMIRDPRDDFLTSGVGSIRVSDPFSGESMVVDIDKYVEEYKKAARLQRLFVEREFHINNGGFVQTYTTEPFVKPLMKYFLLL
ncbi:MAG: DUF58 domain-containing protein [Candidatus Aenigmarchaeota archaeon]|nr:DUF58 domain-containing protein [Candidatus Aenigmarchaeota archaeon]